MTAAPTARQWSLRKVSPDDRDGSQTAVERRGAVLAHADTRPIGMGLGLAPYLIDLSPVRGELVQLTGIHVNAPGQRPFDPVSLFLCCLLYCETKKS